MKNSTIVIKKYENRRLYDTFASRYINLDDIARMVRNGKDLRVVDAKSGEDLTRTTLTQIIVEDSKEQPGGLPVELLRQLIVATDHVGREFVMWYLRSALDAYGKFQGAVHSGLDEMRSAALSPLQLMKGFVGGERSAPEREELQRLRQRVTELESRGRKSPRRRTSRGRKR